MKVIFSHCTQSYPIKFTASNIKVEYVAKGLILKGADVVVINDIIGERSLHTIESGMTKGLSYYIFPRAGKNLLLLGKNLFKCLKLLHSEYRKNDTNILFVGGMFPIFIIQLLVAKFLGYKCVFLTQEWALSLNNTRFIDKIGAYCSCYIYGKFVDAILPISHFLYEKNRHFNKPMLLTPILADFNSEIAHDEIEIHNHFAYCAGTSYFRVIKMMLGAYKKFVDNGGLQKLIMILSGNEESIVKIRKYAKQMGVEEKIIFKHQIPYKELLNIYETSLGLLIPLDPDSVQDKARFSQKIAEYLSVKRPLITSNVGEIPFYFTPNKDIVIADYNEQAYFEAMFFLAKNPTKATSIGKEGFKTGKERFDFRCMGAKMYNFLEKLGNGKFSGFICLF